VQCTPLGGQRTGTDTRLITMASIDCYAGGALQVTAVTVTAQCNTAMGRLSLALVMLWAAAAILAAAADDFGT
jgi:hypothetical protein